jgi:hypothetical protein
VRAAAAQPQPQPQPQPTWNAKQPPHAAADVSTPPLHGGKRALTPHAASRSNPSSMKNATLALIVSGVCALAGQAHAQAPIPERGFLCCNMRSDGSWISDSNYAESGKRIVPLGTPVRFLGFGRNRVQIEIDGRRQAIGNDYSRDLTLDHFAARYIVASNPKDEVVALDSKTRTAIETARVTRGMSRQQVLMALGYPISSETPNLDVRQWRYWLWSFTPFTVNFSDDGKVSSVTTDADTLLKVFLD